MELDNIPSLDGEEWRDIPGYEGYYMVSNMGRVKSLDRMINNHGTLVLRKSKLMSNLMNNDGYEFSMLHKKGVPKRLRINRLVASAFLGLDLNKVWDYKTSLCVCHKDDNPINNRVENLFLGTIKDNNQDAIRKGRKPILKGIDAPMFGIKGSNHPASKPIKQFTKQGAFIMEWESATDAGLKLGIHNGNIGTCCKKKVKTAGGYKWEFK